MANAVQTNTAYVDSTGTLITQKNIQVTQITLSPTAANAQLVLQDVNGTNKIDMRGATSYDTQSIFFKDNPIVFPNGIVASTVTNCVATLHLKRTIS